MAGILLVHGAWQGAWCWDAFAQRLAASGHDVRAVHLRGHDGPRRRIWHRVRGYVCDVEKAASAFTAPPIIVGHSLGGLLTQKYLERNPAPAAVLMASIPPGGTLGLTGRMLLRRPLVVLRATVTLRMRPFVGSAAIVRDVFFSPDTPQETVDAFYARAQDESYLAFLDTMFITWPRPRRVTTPVLVLGGQHDGVFTVAEVQRTARRYHTTAQIYDMGHQMMLERGWEAVADRIAAWVVQHEQSVPR